MGNKQIIIKDVKDLMSEKFYIPSYQRGYRWDKQQITELLNDVYYFEPEKIPDSDEKTWYCLQPLIVKMQENCNRWEVIDGQQRLTTVFLILKCLGEIFNSDVEYETRPESARYINDIINENSEAYIDFHYMQDAKRTILNWKKNHNIEGFLEKLKSHCKVIWYETEDDAYGVFKRLNSGKIPLSNAELVKALLLKKENFIDYQGKYLHLKQFEMANEWDRMEQLFHDDQFWYFICPDPENPYYESTRIDFLLEMIIRMGHKSKLNFNEFNFEHELIQNPYFPFSIFNEKILDRNFGWQKVWEEIIEKFRLFKSWFQKREYYHYIGYLINQKEEKKDSKRNKDMLVRIMISASLSKSEFLGMLQKECLKTLIPNNANYLDFSKLKYGENNNDIHNILLLFNLATVQNQISEQSKYPFNLHYKANKEKWSLEHIHAQNEEDANLSHEDVLKIVEQIKLIRPSLKISENEVLLEPEVLQEAIDAFIKDIPSRYTDKFFYKAIIGAFMGEPIKRTKKIIDNNIVTYDYTSDFTEDHTLTNMALLQGPKNSAFGNRIYPEKKEKLASYEDSQSETEFIPICTRNVFFKHYSPKSTNPLLWDKEAGEEYVSVIVRTIAGFLDAISVEPNTSQEFAYGIKTK